MHAFVVDGSTAGLPVGLGVVARTALASDCAVQGGESDFGIDVGTEGDVGHDIDVEFVVAGVARNSCADSEASLRVKISDETRQGAIVTFEPSVDGVVVVDGELVIGWTKLNPDRYVGEHDVNRRVACDLT